MYLLDDGSTFSVRVRVDICEMRSNQHVFVVSRLLILLVAFNQYTKTTAYQSTGPNGRSVSSNFNQNHIDQPVIKSLKRPLLVVVDPKTKSRIHLVGVSHGSASSAELVKDVFSEIPNAAAVVLELCEDRFWSISLDAKIRPRGNETLAGAFDAKLIVIANHESKKVAAKTNTGIVAVFNEISSALRFAGQQGPIGGTFVLLGLFISNMQRMTRSSTGVS